MAFQLLSKPFSAFHEPFTAFQLLSLLFSSFRGLSVFSNTLREIRKWPLLFTSYMDHVIYLSIYLKVFVVFPLQRHHSPLSGSIWSFIIFSLIHFFFLLSLFSLIFLSCHCFTYIFLSLSFLS